MKILFVLIVTLIVFVHGQQQVLNTVDAPVGIAIAPDVSHLPANFDARDRWPECASIRRVSAQGSCGSCWAHVAADVMSDRFCIASRGALQVQLSAWHLLQCCGVGLCADGRQDFGGCAGGDPYPTLKYIAERGIVSERCKPNPSWLENFGINTWEQGGAAPDEVSGCEESCADSSLDYREQLYFAQSYYRLPNDEATIRKEIYDNGPVMAHVDHRTWQREPHRSRDWRLVFSCGVKASPTHSVRLIGWGVERDGTRYWLAVNSWGREWGVDGTLKIERGRDTCRVESMVTAGVPQL